ncbi:hypothetical protein M3O96_11275 [Aquiflexum sp. TKW24L]|uniref:hypothetical protein n=1 Tax=Aquiflexum sp. TKW24L TaxID=2942212 RepID=UPI0020BF8130|nr:hypothetical protein [Aquiflexum sp. TKW24L]MCL6259675.1 hypothetical protein [Aquiflexum sp. TKW24L]
MKRVFVILLSVMLLSSCSVFGPRPEFYQGMKENKFLRQNRDAVLSTLDGNKITYRVNRDVKFYVLATFEDGYLVKLEERETVPGWMENRPVDGNINTPKE